MKQGIIFGTAIALTSAAIILFQHGQERVYRHGKEDGTKEQTIKFRTKAYPPPRYAIPEKLIRLNKFRDTTLQMLDHMLLWNEIRLQSIPREIRLDDEYNGCLYYSAFRLSSRANFPCERFVDDLNTLCDDILSLDNDDYTVESLASVLSNYLNNNEHEEDEEFVTFKKNLSKDVLRKVLECRYSSEETIKQQLKSFGTE